jgi:hypothetical protein
VRVTRQIVEAPETLTPEQILGEANAEVRRIMIDRFGADRLMREGNATLLDKVHEPDFPGLTDAELWRLDLDGDESLVMLHLRNSTPELDGSYREPWLRVHPELRPMIQDGDGRRFGERQELTCRNAVASTFGLRGEEYLPLVET